MREKRPWGENLGPYVDPREEREPKNKRGGGEEAVGFGSVSTNGGPPPSHRRRRGGGGSCPGKLLHLGMAPPQE